MTMPSLPKGLAMRFDGTAYAKRAVVVTMLSLLLTACTSSYGGDGAERDYNYHGGVHVFTPVHRAGNLSNSIRDQYFRHSYGYRSIR